MMPEISSRRVGVVGSGMVGCSFAFASLQRGLASEIVLVDVDEQRAEGEAMDLSHGLPFVPPARVHSGTYADLSGAAIVVLAAGAHQKPGQTRLDLLQENAAMVSTCVPSIVAANPGGVILVASNPVDVLTHLAAEQARLPWGRVFGSGTTLDTARFRYLIASHFDVDPRSVHAYVIAEHGDTAVPVWSSATVAGLDLPALARQSGRSWDEAIRTAIFDETRTAAYEVIKRKRATYYAIGLALLAITEAVLRNQRTVLTVSVPLKGMKGVSGIALSVPAVVGRAGVEMALDLPLDDRERQAFLASAAALKARLEEMRPLMA